MCGWRVLQCSACRMECERPRSRRVRAQPDGMTRRGRRGQMGDAEENVGMKRGEGVRGGGAEPPLWPSHA
eukprot:8222192-Pyramimonas_sp.AAC.1